MSDWINDEMRDFRAEQERIDRKQTIISYSNYWATLVRQIEKDVQKINIVPEFSSVLKKDAIEFIDSGSYYEVRMLAKPAVFIKIENGGQSVKVEMIVDRFDGNDVVNKQAEFRVFPKKDRIDLELNGQFFVVPEQASRAILKPLLEELKKLVFSSSFTGNGF